LRIYYAHAESRNFSFQAIGSTYNEAIGTLHKGLRAHAKQYNLEPKWFESWADIHVEEIKSGECLRDHEPIKQI
jgi:hypothetical protein